MMGLKILWKLRYSTLTKNIVVLLLVFGITPLAILFLGFQHVFITHEKEDIAHLQKENAVRVAENISGYIDQGMNQAKLFGEMLDSRLSSQNLFLRLDEFLVQHPEYDQITLMDFQGREISKAAQDYTYRAFELRDRSADPDFQRALKGHSSISPVELLPGSRIPRMRFFFPLTDFRDRVFGVLEARMNIIPIWRLLAKTNLGDNRYVYLIDPKGRLIAGQDISLRLINKDLSKLPIVQALETETTGVWEYRGLHDQQVIGASALVPATGWAVIVEESRWSAHGPIYRAAAFILFLFAFTLMAAVIRGLIFSQHRIIGPVKALQQEIESLSRGVFPQGLNVTGSDELGQLSQAFDQMVQHLKKTMVSRDLLAREVAERQLTEEALRSSEATLRSIFLTVPLGIGSLHQWLLVGGNDYFSKITGYPEKEIRGENLSRLFVHQTDYRKMVKQLRRTLGNEETAAIETQWCRRDGQVRDIFIKFATIDKYDVEADIVFAAMDISDLRRMEQERLRMDKLESLGILAGGIAHDFNNILTVILGNIELVGLEIKHEGKNLDRLLEAEQACQRAQHLAKQLLTFAKGGMPVKKTITVTELLQDVVPLALSGSNSATEILVDEDVWSIEIDEDQIHQVINNILINADQAMPDGGLVTIEVKNLLLNSDSGVPLPAGKYVRISIVDQGMGISQKDLDKIFDPYFTTKQLGNGLGLTAAYSIIKNHQGHITVDSKVGKGTSFHLYLPATETTVLPTNAKVSTMPLRGHGRVLVMDDEASIREVLGHMLHKLGYEAVCVKDGGEVLETYQRTRKNNEHFDAVILDLTIPGGLGGRETLELLLQLDPQVQAIVSSGYGDDPIMANYKNFGFKSVIAKPYKISELSLILHNLLHQKDMRLSKTQNQEQPAFIIDSH
jgi:PAS domain S-box-containing protein